MMANKIEFRDLKTQYLRCKPEMDSAIQNVLLNGHFIGGDPVYRLEENLAEYVGVKHCISCANGTDALQLSLMAWDIGEGDAVFVPDFTFFSTAEVVPWMRATPVFVDVEKDTYNISPRSLETAIREVIKEGKLMPRVIIAVDLFGLPADFVSIREIAEKYDLLLLEDGAQGFGGKIGENMACSFGDISITSFFPAKPLGCYGDGGAVFTNDDEWAKLIRSYKVHGKGEDKYDNVRIGMNSRLDTLQAAVLLEKMKLFEEEVTQCNTAAGEYTNRLKEIVKVPIVLDGMRSSWAQYTVCLGNSQQRDRVMRRLKEEEIPTAVYYKRPMHLQPAFGKNAIAFDCHVTENICETCLSLPMHAYLEVDAIARICDIIRAAAEDT